jgi:hypothetical protein
VLTGPWRGPVPLARLEAAQGPQEAPPAPDEPAAPTAGAEHSPPRIVVYRRPLLARADGEEDLGELVFDVVVEEFAHLLGIDPEDVDPGYTGGGE